MTDRLHTVITEQHNIVDHMVHPNGAVYASPWLHYKAHWLRDGLYTLEAYKHLGIHKRQIQLLNAPMNIFHRYDRKIRYGVRQRPEDDYKFIHARYSPYTLEEIPGDWGHNQLDVLGLFLYEIADLSLKFPGLFHELDVGRRVSSIVVNNVTRYLNTMKWWEFGDYGVWEEGPDQHSSSLGAVIGGLKKLEAMNDKSPGAELFFELEQLERGQSALSSLLPRESVHADGLPNRTRDCDLSQLSLIWPFEVLSEKDEDIVLERIENSLVRKNGVIRYANDPYFNAADDRLVPGKLESGESCLIYSPGDSSHFPATIAGHEAEWPLGFAWLSIVYSHLAQKRGDARAQEYRDKAMDYWERLMATTLKVRGRESGLVPELYTRGEPNANTPLTWASAFAVVASVKLAELRK